MFVSEWGRHCSDNGLSPIRRQAIIHTNSGSLSVSPSATNFQNTELFILIHKNSSENIVCEMAAILSEGDELNESNDSYMKFQPAWASANWKSMSIYQFRNVVLRVCKPNTIIDMLIITHGMATSKITCYKCRTNGSTYLSQIYHHHVGFLYRQLWASTGKATETHQYE